MNEMRFKRNIRFKIVMEVISVSLFFSIIGNADELPENDLNPWNFFNSHQAMRIDVFLHEYPNSHFTLQELSIIELPDNSESEIKNYPNLRLVQICNPYSDSIIAALSNSENYRIQEGPNEIGYIFKADKVKRSGKVNAKDIKLLKTTRRYNRCLQFVANLDTLNLFTSDQDYIAIGHNTMKEYAIMGMRLSTPLRKFYLKWRKCELQKRLEKQKENK